ncbi:MAG: tetratricopeptide repeat protein [Nitrosopumilaceae archaeon]|jgi:tetratricopeptide (TPR) repeat protein
MNELSEIVSKGENFMENSQYEDALACFEQAILLSPEDPDLWNSKASALRSMGRYEEAIECFNRSLEIDPRDKYSS